MATECKRIDVSKEVYECLAKVMILVMGSVIFVVKEYKSFDFNKEVYECLTKVVILVRAFMNFKSKLEDAFSMFNVFDKSIDFSKDIYNFQIKNEGCL